MLENLKMLLGLTDDDSRDDILSLIINLTTARLKLLIGGIEPPEELEHIIIDVAVARFNRIGSEGLSNHSVEGESLSFAENDFAPFMSEKTVLLASGIISERADDVVACFENNGFKIVERAEDNGWCALAVALK